MTLSTHVLDTDAGRPVVGMWVWARGPEGVRFDGTTDSSGRIGELVPPDGWEPGEWRIVFDTHEHSPFYPHVSLHIVVADSSHHHIPLLLARYGYSTYRGS